MFSRNFMVNLLFANPDDTYYTDGLLRFDDLNEYIWYDIRKNGIFDSVYFLCEEKGFFNVSSMGDCTRETFSPGFFGNKYTQFKTWLVECLKDKKSKCALVCPLSDFCRLLEMKEWKPLLEALLNLSADSAHNGVLILTGTPYVENVRPWLLESPVFDRYEVRKKSVSLCPAVANMRDNRSSDCTYDSLQDAMGDACVFLNKFDDRSVEAIVNQAILRRGHKVTVDPALVEDYLKRTLNSRKRGYEPLMELFPKESVDLGFKDLYRLLSDSSTWRRVEQLALEPSSYGEFDTCRVPMFYKNHVINQCLGLKAPESGLCEEGKKEFIRFKQAILSAKNKPLNQNILKRLETLHDKYNRHKRNECDKQVLRLLLTVLRVGATWLYVEEGSKAEGSVLKISEFMDNYLEIWGHCAKLSNDLEAASFTTTNVDAQKLQHTYRTRLEQLLSGYRGKLQILEQGIYALNTSAQIEKYDFSLMEDAVREIRAIESYDTGFREECRKIEDESREQEEIYACEPPSDDIPVSKPEPEEPDPEELYDIVPTDYIDCPI